MSLLSVSSAETDLIFVSNLDTSSTERVNKNGFTGTGTAYGTLTQESNSLTGNYSYKFTSGAYIEHGSSSGFGTAGDVSLEVVFKKSGSVASGGECIVRRRGNTTAGDGASIILNADGTITTLIRGYNSSQSTITTSGTYNDDKWHHVVLVWKQYNYYRLYIDGTLVGTNSANVANIGGGYVILGANRSQSGSNSYSQYFTGSIDFFAAYNPAPGNSSAADTFVANHVAEFANRIVDVDVMNATTALFVHPNISVGKNISVDPATASSLFVDPKVSNFDEPQTLLTYITDLEPNYYIRFKDINFDNEIPGTDYTGWSINASPVFKEISGVSTEPSIVLDNVPGSMFLRGEFRPNNPGGVLSDFATYFRDDNVSVGFWLKTTDADATIFEAFELDIGNTWAPFQPANYNLTIVSDGTLNLSVGFTDANEEPILGALSSEDPVNDGEWHFIAFRFDGDSLKLYLDGALQGTETGLSTVGTRFTINTINFGGYSDTEWSSLILGPYSLLTDSVVSDIWDIGTAGFQAQSQMVDPIIKISTAFYDKVDDLEPILNYKLDGTLTPISTINNDYATLLTASTFNSAWVSYGYPAKNVNAYRIQDTRSNWNGIFETPSGTFTTNNEWSISTLIKIDPEALGGGNGYYGPRRLFALLSGNGLGDIGIGYNDDHWFAYTNEQWYLTELTLESTSAIDDKWHLLTATFDGTYFKLYVDGIEEASQDTSTYYSETPYQTADSGLLLVGGGENFWFGQDASTDVDKIIDHTAIFNYALSDVEIFELWQSVGVDPMIASNATLPLPVGLAGYGPTINPGVMYVSAELVNPGQEDTVAPTILPMTAFIDTVTPNFAATSTVTIAASPMTASAQGENPVLSVGENNGVLHMEASAEFMDPDILIPGFWNANPFIATNARIVDPGVVTTQGGLVLVQVMTASTSMVLPPAYKSLFDDKWYDLLYSQHSVRHGVRFVNGGNGEAILKLFDDVTVDKAVGSTIKNNLSFTITTDGLVVDNTEPEMNVIGAFTPTNNTPLLGKGYFDDYERKAVRFNNITTGYEGSEYSNTAFSFELSIKTTKSDQIIAFGKTRSFYGYSQFTTSYGLSDGKLFLKATSATGPAATSHYKEATPYSALLIGNKRIDDGQWHHIVIQNGWDDNRVQFWIDGDLDKQKIGGFRLDGPSFLGFNSQIATYASDFQTSVWSYDSHAFARELEIDNHRYAYIKYEPVRAEPMLASATSGDHLAKGNRARALMLYWWPTDTFQGAPYPPKFDSGGIYGNPTFAPELSTADFIKSGPQEYYGWDVFPVDITGLYVSDLVKPEAYGGKENIIVGSKPFIGTGQNYSTNPQYLFNSQGSFKDPVTDARRYIDVVNDIDLRNFDAIFFKNFPDEAIEKDEFTTNQIVDSYFGSKEVALYEDFLKSLRAAVDTGLSLYVTNYQLALDLGIVDRVETVPDMDELTGFDSDPYSPTIAPGTAPNLVIDNASQWYDAYKNNRVRVVNTLEGFTTEPSFIRTDYIYYRADDANNFGEPNRPFNRFVYRPNGLQIGDEFIIANDLRGGPREFYATPFANVKAGTIITAFANTIKRRTETITNPYANYATCIVVKPGDVLKGTQCGGKIVVNFTENLNGAYDNGDVDLVSDYWINVAYNDGYIDEATKNTYLNAPYNIDRQLENNLLSQENYNKLAFWSSNGMNIITNATLIDDPTESRPKDGLGKGVRSELVTKTRKSGTAYTAKVSTSQQWFSFAYAWKYPRMGIKVPNILTRGFWWLSNRESYDGIVERPLATTASAIFVDPVVTGQKDRSVNATSMIASATIVQAVGTSAAAINIAPLPFQATALMNNYVTRYTATPMTASAVLRTNNRVFTTAVDEVVVYVYHTDPILYLREDVIK